MASTDLTKIRVKIKGFDSAVVDKAASDILNTAINTGAKVLGPVPLPTKTSTFAVNRGPFIDKRSMEHFKHSVHKRFIIIYALTPKTVEALQKLQLAAGVGISIK